MSSDDTTPDFLEPKLEAGTNITLTVINPAGNERIRISATAAVCNPLTDTRFVDGGTAVPPASQNGTICAPFSTIQAAITALGGVGAVVVDFNGGAPYVEALSIPAGSNLIVRAFGGPVFLLSGNVTFAQGADSTVLFENMVAPATNFIAAAGATAVNLALVSTVSNLFGSPLAGGASVDFSASTGAHSLALRSVRLDAGAGGRAINATTGELAAVESDIVGDLPNLLQGFSAASTCAFESSFTVTTAPTVDVARGLLQSVWRALPGGGAPVWSGPALSLLLDSATLDSFYRSGGTFAGGATPFPTDYDPPLFAATTFVPTALVPTRTALLEELVPYDPSPAVVGQTIFAPAGGVRGHRWGSKNMTTSVTAITIDGNGVTIEDPAAPGAPVASFSIGLAGVALEWEKDAAGVWRLV